MVTRRIVLGAGMAFTSLACAAGFGAYTPTAQHRRNAQAIDALLIDEGIEMPREIAVLITASKLKFPIVAVQLDAATHARLVRVLKCSRVIAGISSGATLFCLERIAWDHGFRLTGRTQQCASDPNQQAQQDVAAFLGGTLPAANPSILVQAYRPSRADATLHAWVMQKSARRSE
jgi:hypothetical protein